MKKIQFKEYNIETVLIFQQKLREMWHKFHPSNILIYTTIGCTVIYFVSINAPKAKVNLSGLCCCTHVAQTTSLFSRTNTLLQRISFVHCDFEPFVGKMKDVTNEKFPPAFGDGDCRWEAYGRILNENEHKDIEINLVCKITRYVSRTNIFTVKTEN